jgi:Na+/melibiose symporter-like transporter
VGSPFSFWSAGTDDGIPERTRRWPRRTFWLTAAAFAIVIVLVAIFVNPT